MNPTGFLRHKEIAQIARHRRNARRIAREDAKRKHASTRKAGVERRRFFKDDRNEP